MVYDNREYSGFWPGLTPIEGKKTVAKTVVGFSLTDRKNSHTVLAQLFRPYFIRHRFHILNFGDFQLKLYFLAPGFFCCPNGCENIGQNCKIRG